MIIEKSYGLLIIYDAQGLSVKIFHDNNFLSFMREHLIKYILLSRLISTFKKWN